MKMGRKPGMQSEGGAGGDDSPAARPEGARDIPPAKRKPRRSGRRGYLDGQMLIAMPTMGDERFARSVIYMCAHSSDGAMGIIVNQPATNISFPDLLVQLEVVPAADLIQLPRRAGTVKVLRGRPAGDGNPGERLAALLRRPGADLRRRYRGQVRAGAEEDRHLPRHAVER